MNSELWSMNDHDIDDLEMPADDESDDDALVVWTSDDEPGYCPLCDVLMTATHDYPLSDGSCALFWVCGECNEFYVYWCGEWHLVPESYWSEQA